MSGNLLVLLIGVPIHYFALLKGSTMSESIQDFLGRFPEVHKFIDCAGCERVFRISVYGNEGSGYGFRAIEVVDADEGYEFSAFSGAGPIEAFTEVVDKIRTALARRFLNPKSSKPELLTDEAQGHVSYGGVVIDGRFVSWDELAEMIQEHEGWEFKLEFGS